MSGPLVPGDVPTYIAYWKWAFNSIFLGVWGKILASLCLAMFYWFGLRSKQMGMALTWLALAGLFAYGAPLLGLFGVKGGQ